MNWDSGPGVSPCEHKGLTGETLVSLGEPFSERIAWEIVDNSSANAAS